MEMTRRENDRRIRSLYVEMKEMIAVLVQYVTPRFRPLHLSLTATPLDFVTSRILKISALMEKL